MIEALLLLLLQYLRTLLFVLPLFHLCPAFCTLLFVSGIARCVFINKHDINKQKVIIIINNNIIIIIAGGREELLVGQKPSCTL